MSDSYGRFGTRDKNVEQRSAFIQYQNVQSNHCYAGNGELVSVLQV